MDGFRRSKSSESCFSGTRRRLTSGSSQSEDHLLTGCGEGDAAHHPSHALHPHLQLHQEKKEASSLTAVMKEEAQEEEEMKVSDQEEEKETQEEEVQEVQEGD